MSTTIPSGILRAVATALLMLPATAPAAPAFNMPEGVTEISREVYGLHMLIFGICVLIGVVVFTAMLISIVLYRRSRGAEAAQFHESTLVEVIWTVIPFLILIGMAIPAAGTLIHMEDTRDAEMTVKVTGYQWKWHYEYLDQDISFFSNLAHDSNVARQKGSGVDVSGVDNYLLDVDEPLVVPVDTKIRFMITAADVIHAWWVPDLAIKKDAIPGFINEIWAKIDEPGVYRGQCAELCGRDHGFMPVVVEARPKAEFEAWVERRQEDGAAPAGDS